MIWPVVPLSQLLLEGLTNGRSVPDEPGGFPVLRLTAMREGVLDLTKRKEGAWTIQKAERFLVRQGDFFVTRGNGSLELVGRGSLVVAEPDSVAFPDTMIRVRCKPDLINSKFLALAWNAPETRRQIEGMARTTAGIYKVNQKHLLSITLPLPPLAEQRRIVDILEGHLSHLDAAAQDLRRAARRLHRFRASSLSELWQRSRKDGNLLQVSDLGQIVTGSTPSAKLPHEPFGGKIPFLTPSDVFDGEEIVCWNRSLNEYGASVSRTVPPNAIAVVCIGATLGKVGWIRQASSGNQQINFVLPSEEAGRSDYFAALMASPEFQVQLRDAASSTTMPILNKSKFSKLNLPAGNRSLQEESMNRLRITSETRKRSGEEIQRAIFKEIKLRRSLLSAAFSGRLTGRSTDQDVAEGISHV